MENDDEDFTTICELPEDDIRRCEKCDSEHTCKRCIKNTHTCNKCGSLSYECDICGAILGSLTELKKHQTESKICKKAKYLTASSIEEELKKFGKDNLQRRYSQIIMDRNSN
jgi:hypothetical protein